MNSIHPPPSVVPYQSAGGALTPSYTALRIGAGVLNVIGMLYLAGGLVCFILAMVVVITTPIAPTPMASPFRSTPTPSALPPSWLAASPLLFLSFVSIAAGVVQMILASMALAIRDIARNSFTR